MKTQSALCAKHIRNFLKKLYPETKFSIYSKNYSMGDSVNVSWKDGVPYNEIENILKKYQYGSFNSMEDTYEYTNKNKEIPQTKFLFLDRITSV